MFITNNFKFYLFKYSICVNSFYYWMLYYINHFTELLCKSTPQLHSAIEITNFGCMYLLENDYKSATEKFKTGLNLLENLMEREPQGIRYNLLTKQVSQ